MQGQAHQNKLLLFQVGPVKCSVFSNDILTIIPPPRQETAGRAGRLPGIFRHNNRIARVVDMRSKFGLSPSSPDRGRLILTEIPKGLVAFWVDQIINVIDQEDGRWDILPATLPHDVFTRTFVLDEELILHTECPRMEAMSPSAALTEHIEKLQEEQEKAHLTRTTPPVETPSAKPDKPIPPASRPDSQATAAPARPEAERERPKANLPPRSPQTGGAAPATRPTARHETEKPTPRPPGGLSSPAASPPRPGTDTRPETGKRPASPKPAPKPMHPSPVPARETAPRPITDTAPRPAPAAPQRPSVATTPPAEPPREEPTYGEGGGLIWLFLLLLLLFLGGSGALLYFNGFFGTGPAPASPPPVAEVQEPNWQPPVLGEPESPAPPPATPAEDEIPPSADTLPDQVPPAGPETPPAEAVMPPVEEPETAPGESPEETPAPPYSASIEKDDQGITITLEGPVEAPQDSLLKEEAPGEAAATPEPAPPAEPETEAATEETPPAPEAKPETPKPAAKKQKRIITHVVVKGDTLWDIAERYVKDPYRYPELARLSGIKNPDLIYPGDVVRIVEK